MCPVCTIAVTAGVGLSRWLGVDDLISGLWVGGLLVSLIGLTFSLVEQKGFEKQSLKASCCFPLLFFDHRLPVLDQTYRGPLQSHLGLGPYCLGDDYRFGGFPDFLLFSSLAEKEKQSKGLFPLPKGCHSCYLFISRQFCH